MTEKHYREEFRDNETLFREQVDRVLDQELTDSVIQTELVRPVSAAEREDIANLVRELLPSVTAFKAYGKPSGLSTIEARMAGYTDPDNRLYIPEHNILFDASITDYPVYQYEANQDRLLKDYLTKFRISSLNTYKDAFTDPLAGVVGKAFSKLGTDAFISMIPVVNQGGDGTADGMRKEQSIVRLQWQSNETYLEEGVKSPNSRTATQSLTFYIGLNSAFSELLEQVHGNPDLIKKVFLVLQIAGLLLPEFEHLKLSDKNANPGRSLLRLKGAINSPIGYNTSGKSYSAVKFGAHFFDYRYIPSINRFYPALTEIMYDNGYKGYSYDPASLPTPEERKQSVVNIVDHLRHLLC